MTPNEKDPLVSSEAGYGSASSTEETGIPKPLMTRIKETLSLFWYLGFIAFGGPTAHVAILRDHLVGVHKFIDEDVFTELFALGQGLPGPSSTQLVISTASTHGGAISGVIAFAFWCLPGFAVLTLSGLYLYSFVDPSSPPIWLLGISPAAMSLIFKASFKFVQKLDKFGTGIGLVACAVAVMIAGDEHYAPTISQVVYPILLVSGAILSLLDYLRGPEKSIGTYFQSNGEITGPTDKDRMLVEKIGLSIFQGFAYFFTWLTLLILSVAIVNLTDSNLFMDIFEVYFRVGSLVFGGGIVVLPMLQSELVPRGWVTNEQFFQGLGIAQSMPGPMFNFAAFLGAVTNGFPGSLTAAVGLFGPGFILIFAMLPFWSRFRHLAWFKAVLKGLNASAIGLIVAGCVTLYPKSVHTYADTMVFILTGGLATIYSFQAPFVIFWGCVLGAIFSSSVLDVGQKHIFETI
jgi:chromate transporter